MGNTEIRKKMELEQKRAFCKQSCTKIDQGLDRLDPRSGERAIWELFQNARDLARVDNDGEKKAFIKITLTPTEFIFSHQGRAFDHDSLTSLVMQVSSQGKETDETVGQYGTGFLTTHVFGRKLYVTGSLDLSAYAPGNYANIDRFTIDRTYNNMPEFVEKVARQLLAVTDYADAEKTPDCRQWTELSYDLSSMEGAKENATSAITSAVSVIPYVMTINKPIVSVILENQLTRDIFQFEKEQLPDEGGLKVMQVSVTHNGVLTTRKIYYLESEDGEDIAILPLKSPTETQSLRGIAKLFVFFPLLGTEEFGMEAIFHSKKFIPVEERDGLHLPVSNVNVRAKYEQNVRVLNSLTEMVHNYYRNHAESISNWVEVAGLSFDCEHHKEEVTKNYFCDFKKKWSVFYQSLPIIDFNGSRVNVNTSNVRFLAPGIVEDIENRQEGAQIVLHTLYDAASYGFHLVDSNNILEWSKVVASWDRSHPSMIEVEDIARELSNSDKVPLSTLRAFGTYLSERKLVSLFDSYTLIPNRDGKKMKKSALRDASTIPGWLSDIANGLVSDKVESFADDSFTRLIQLTPFSRNDLRDAVTSKLRSLRQDYLDKGKIYEAPVIDILLEFCSVFATETASKVRRKATTIIAEHRNREFSTRVLPYLDSNERDVAELPFKHLVECMLLEISQKDSEWIKNNIEYITSLHSELCTWTEYYNRNTKDGLCTKYGAFPNRNAQPCMARELEKGVDIPEALARLYMDVMGRDLNERLVDERFEDLYDFSKLTAKDVAGEIEDELEENGFHHPAVLDIINNLKEGSEWNVWFSRVASKKAELFLGRVQEDCKESIFKLMKINDSDKLNQLAELADEADLDEIINKGRASIIERKNKEADFNFKLLLGQYVEEIIRRYLADSISDDDITVTQEKYGCDLTILKNGKPIYYIEVKSRWSTDQSVMMSPLQMRTSVEQTGNYALCCVNMSHFGLSEAEEHKYPNLEEVLPYITAITDIGTLNREIFTIAEGSENRPIFIGGDYKCVVPQSTIQGHGKSFSSLVDIILNKI